MNNRRNYHWSYEYKAPFLPGATAFIDPHKIELHATVSITFISGGLPMIEAVTIGEGDNSTTALYRLAQAIDTRYDDLHAFSDDRSITIQPAAGSDARFVRLSITPYTVPPASTLFLDHPNRTSGATPLTLSLGLDQNPLRTFSVPRTSSLQGDLSALASKINKVAFLRAEITANHFVVSATPGRALASGVLAYG